MNEKLKAVAAAYASALKVSERLAPAGGGDRPSALDIWLYKQEDAAATLVQHWKRKKRPEGVGYDRFHLYAHRYCLNSAEDVQSAPDSVLFEAMGLSPSQELGWLQFMVRDLAWHSMLAANWGHPVLVIPDGVTYDTTTEEQRRAQAVSYYLELMRERGSDPLPHIHEFTEGVRARFRGRRGRELREEELSAWMRRRRPWLFYLYTFGDRPNPPSLLSKPGEPKYDGDFKAQLLSQICEAATELGRELVVRLRAAGGGAGREGGPGGRAGRDRARAKERGGVAPRHRHRRGPRRRTAAAPLGAFGGVDFGGVPHQKRIFGGRTKHISCA